ncbi:hypothetical protein CVS40_11074 [Lucilia cuprina]|nr:hypothetical protein CVS40_11074 [Lucilia cuprina]
MFAGHSGKKPSNNKSEREERDRNFIDMSGTINTPSNNSPPNNETTTTTSRGAIPKTTNPQQFQNFSIPPPLIPKSHQPTEKNAREYANLIKDLIKESNTEYRSDLEEKIELKIKDSLRLGFSEMLKEIQKIARINRSSEGSCDMSEERRKSDGNNVVDIEKEESEVQHIIPRRLDFQYVPLNSETDSNNPNNPLPNNNRQISSIRIDKWDVVFDGNNENLNVEDFIFRIEYLQQHHGCPWMEVMGEWYWSVIREKQIRKWSDLKSALLQQYRSNRSEYEFMRDFEERRQRPGEPINAYFSAMRKLRTRLRTPLPEHEVVRIIKRNLRTNLSQILYPMKIYTVEQLRDECIEIERNYFRREPIVMPYSRYTCSIRVEEVFENQAESEDWDQVEEIRVNRNKVTKPETNQVSLICWNCRCPGHSFMDCPSVQRNLFCYKCGLVGVITPKCPKCLENSMRSVSKTGESRSTQTPAN